MAEIFMTQTAKEREGIKDVKPAGVKTIARKEGMGRRVARAFISEERGNIKEHVIFDVVIPAIKNAVVDVITDGINMLLYGEKRSRKDKSGRTAYGSFWASSLQESNRRAESSGATRTSSMGRYMDAAWESKEEAKDVLECMSTILDSYPAVTVADFYGLIDDDKNFPIESIHNKWGWKSLAGVDVVKLGGGLWGLSLPRPTHLD